MRPLAGWGGSGGPGLLWEHTEAGWTLQVLWNTFGDGSWSREEIPIDNIPAGAGPVQLPQSGAGGAATPAGVRGPLWPARGSGAIITLSDQHRAARGTEEPGSATQGYGRRSEFRKSLRSPSSAREKWQRNKSVAFLFLAGVFPPKHTTQHERTGHKRNRGSSSLSLVLSGKW